MEHSRRRGLILLLMIAQSHSRAAVLGDELDTGQLQGLPDH
jgi:hypothetical protein